MFKGDAFLKKRYSITTRLSLCSPLFVRGGGGSVPVVCWLVGASSEAHEKIAVQSLFVRLNKLKGYTHRETNKKISNDTRYTSLVHGKCTANE